MGLQWPLFFITSIKWFCCYKKVLLGFCVLVGASAWVDVLGMIAGHAYYFLEDVYPRMTGRRPLKTPSYIRSLFADEPITAANVRFAPPPVEEVQQN
ncbi:derlin-2.2-like isoform X2 [Cornus florida]|uniref:derlin-2.2-like isoform X2 n=1 Tax=Cornus florida TaxID=4283 RepID=UPI00289FD778|nr:derlin-2.2-like isoform X2 [Cornus florida]